MLRLSKVTFNGVGRLRCRPVHCAKKLLP